MAMISETKKNGMQILILEVNKGEADDTNTNMFSKRILSTYCPTSDQDRKVLLLTKGPHILRRTCAGSVCKKLNFYNCSNSTYTCSVIYTDGSTGHFHINL